MLLPSAGSLLVLVVFLLGFPGWTVLAIADESPEFCSTLAGVNRGEVDTREFPELAGHVRVIETLLDSSPDEIRIPVFASHASMSRLRTAMPGRSTRIPRVTSPPFRLATPIFSQPPVFEATFSKLKPL